ANYKVHHTTKKRPFEVHAIEKQHLQKVTTSFSFENNLTNSITRSIRKDNVIWYESNRYTVPTGTYRPKKSNQAYIEVTDEDRLLIRLSASGEVIADHAIHSGKGELIQDSDHKRKRSNKIDQWQKEIQQAFQNKEQIEEFISILREKYPRHLGDQFSILWNLIQQEANWINQALDRAMDLQLKSANDLRDLLISLKREEENTDSQDKGSQECSTSNYSHISASTRNLDSYIEIMNGGKTA
ncbi:IS21 family transposase, partial [Bacillus sp. DJP31]